MEAPRLPVPGIDYPPKMDVSDSAESVPALFSGPLFRPLFQPRTQLMLDEDDAPSISLHDANKNIALL
jgi:hypothetical protein